MSNLNQEYSHKSNKVSTHPIPGIRDSAGIAYIFIPEDIDRDKFLFNAYRTGRVSLLTENSERFDNVRVSKNIFNFIDFPQKIGELGSMVVWILLPKKKIPIIVGTVNKDREYIDLSEHEFSIRKVKGSNLVEILGNAKLGNLYFNVECDQKGGGNLIFNIRNKDPLTNGGGSFKAFVSNKIDLEAAISMQLTSQEEFKVIIRNFQKDKQKKQTIIKYVREQGFSYVDEFGNNIQIDDTGVIIQTNKNLIKIDQNGAINISSQTDNILIETPNNEISMSGSGINIDAGGENVYINGQNNVLYSKIPSASSILDVSEIGISQSVKVGN